MIESVPTSAIEAQPLEGLNADRRMPITMGQFAVGARRSIVRNSFSDIIGPDETRKLVEAREALLDATPKAVPHRGSAVRFRSS